METWRKELYAKSIYHHGILGQKWGNRNGPPYPLKASDHSANERKEGYTKSIGGGRNEEKYGRKASSPAVVNKNTPAKKENDAPKKTFLERTSEKYQKELGLSKEEADAEALKKKELIKKVAIAAGITVAAAAAIYIGHEIGKTYCDDIIKQGTKIQTLSANPNRIADGRAFFESHTTLDKLKYNAVFATEGKDIGNLALWSFKDPKYKIEAIANKDVRIAGVKKSRQIFDDLMKNDSEFRQLFNQYNYKKSASKLGKTGWKYKYRPTYDSFNAIATIDGQKFDSDADREIHRKLIDKFYKEAAKRGYGGIADVNDRVVTGMNSNANIIFDNDKFDVSSVKKITKEEVYKGRAAMYSNKAIVETLPLHVASLVGSIGGKKIYEYDKEVANKYKK